MKIQSVKFPETPEATVEVIKELRPFIDRYFSKIGEGNTSALPAETLAILWHSAQVDFIELLDDEQNRVGLLMFYLYVNPITQKSMAMFFAGSAEQTLVEQGWVGKMFDFAQDVYRARRFSCIEITDRLDSEFFRRGKPVATVYRVEL